MQFIDWHNNRYVNDDGIITNRSGANSMIPINSMNGLNGAILSVAAKSPLPTCICIDDFSALLSPAALARYRVFFFRCPLRL
jgi:hypothetical protein